MPIMRDPDGGHTLPLLMMDIHQRVVKSPTAVFHALNQTLYPLVIVQQQVVDDHEAYGLLKVGFHRAWHCSHISPNMTVNRHPCSI